MGIGRECYGKMPDGREVSLFRLSNEKGMRAAVTNYGGIITELHAPDRDGKPEDVTLGFGSLEPYFGNPAYFGALVGRYANRIAGAAFELNGRVFNLLKNDGNNHLHGGAEGFHRKLWDARAVSAGGLDKLELTCRSADMEEGYPGNLAVKVLYSLDDSGAFAIEYFAESDGDTVVNLTNHAYFNLAGHGAGFIGGHMLTILADRFTPVDGECIPTGELWSVGGTPFDFRKPANIGVGLMREEADEQMRNGHGYDHNFVLNGSGKGIAKAAEVYEPASGRRMEVFTDKPGLQFYSGNHIGALSGKGGALYQRRCGFCLETQHFPDSIHRKNFPSPVLRAGEKYHFTTKYVFSTDKD
jgi:aldose 1-epimerase